MMLRNPEFQRQLWLRWSPSLLGWSLALTALVLALPVVLDAPAERIRALYTTALMGLWIAPTLYGSVLAGRSLSEEAHHNTWDWQRLSSLSPWQMTWGKLLGATVPAWTYTLWFALTLLVVGTVWMGDFGQSLHAVAMAVLWGLALQAWAMATVLLGWGSHDRPRHQRRAVLLPLVLLVLLPLPFARRLWNAFQHGNDPATLWWGLPLGSLGAVYLLGGVFLALGLLSVWRQLAQRLDLRTVPWAWPAGLCVAGFTLGGLASPAFSSSLALTTSLALLGTGYMALHSMDAGLRSWRRVQWCASQGRWRDLAAALPLWTISWALALLASLLAWAWPEALVGEVWSAGPFTTLLCLQVLRDALLLTGFSLLAGRLRSPRATFVTAWAVLNIVLPLLVAALWGQTAVLALQPLVAITLLSESSHHIPASLPWIALAVQLALVLAWVVTVFRRRVLGAPHSTSPAAT